jgi:hypothetical protein
VIMVLSEDPTSRGRFGSCAGLLSEHESENKAKIPKRALKRMTTPQ